MSGYALDNSWDKAKRRLALLEHFLDPKTKRRLQALGVSQGWNCLEIAAGGGSIARWFCEAVGDSESQTIDEAKLSRAMALLADPDFWAFSGGEVAVWGRKSPES